MDIWFLNLRYIIFSIYLFCQNPIIQTIPAMVNYAGWLFKAK